MESRVNPDLWGQLELICVPVDYLYDGVWAGPVFCMDALF